MFDRNCVRCHSGLTPARGFDFSGGLIAHDKNIPGYGHNRAYETIMEKGLVAISKVREQDASITPPLAYGARLSRLLRAMNRHPHDQEVQLTPADLLRLSMWIDANAPYHDAFVNKRPDSRAYDLASDDRLLQSITKVHERRCGGCHKPQEISRLDWIDLHQPGQSRFLSAPFAGAATECKGAVYKDTSDPDYKSLRETVEAAVKKAWAAPRRDLQALVDDKNSRPEQRAGHD